jgi:hypothetical protein
MKIKRLPVGFVVPAQPIKASTVIPGGVEHEGYVPEDSEAIDFFAPGA